MPGPRVAKQRKKLVDDVARLLAGRRQRTRGGVRNARMPSTAKPVYYGQLRARGTKTRRRSKRAVGTKL